MGNFSSKQDGQWFWFNPKNPEDGGVCLRELSVEEAERIKRKTTKTKLRIVGNRPIEMPDTDDEAVTRMTWDYCILGWKGVKLDDEVLECNSENKIRIMNSIDFVKFLSQCTSEMLETNRTLEEIRRKNSSPSSSGSLTNPTASSV